MVLCENSRTRRYARFAVVTFISLFYFWLGKFLHHENNLTRTSRTTRTHISTTYTRYERQYELSAPAPTTAMLSTFTCILFIAYFPFPLVSRSSCSHLDCDARCQSALFIVLHNYIVRTAHGADNNFFCCRCFFLFARNGENVLAALAALLFVTASSTRVFYIFHFFSFYFRNDLNCSPNI